MCTGRRQIRLQGSERKNVGIAWEWIDLSIFEIITSLKWRVTSLGFGKCSIGRHPSSLLQVALRTSSQNGLRHDMHCRASSCWSPARDAWRIHPALEAAQAVLQAWCQNAGCSGQKAQAKLQKPKSNCLGRPEQTAASEASVALPTSGKLRRRIVPCVMRHEGGAARLSLNVSLELLVSQQPNSAHIFFLSPFLLWLLPHSSACPPSCQLLTCRDTWTFSK